MNPYILLALGLILIFLEFFIPGAVFGISGLLFVLASISIFASQTASLWLLILYFVVVCFLIYGIFKIAIWRIRSTKSKNTLFLNTDQEGYKADMFNAALVGKHGVATTDLRPAGRILVQNKTYQAISQGDFIPNGSSIIIIGGEGPTLIVKIDHPKEK